MGDSRVEGSDIKQLLKVARRQPVNFAFNPAKADEDGYLALHRKKPAAVLGKEAKSEGEGTKFSFGSASLQGRLLSLRVERELPQLAKRIKRYLKANKVMVNVQVMDLDGNVIESDIEDDLPDDPDLAEEEVQEDAEDQVTAGNDAPAADGQDPKVDAAALAKRLGFAKERIAELPDAAREKLMAAFAAVVGRIKSGDIAGATEGVDRIDAALAKLSSATAPPPPPSDQALKLVQVLKTLKQQADALADAAAVTAIGRDIAQAANLVKAGDATGATAALLAIRDEIRQAAEAGSKQEDITGTWSAATNAAGASFTNLRATISGLGHTDLTRIATAALSDVLGPEQAALARAVAAWNTSALPDRASAAKTVTTEIATVRQALAGSEVIRLCDNNPFGVQSDIGGTLARALDRIETAVAG